MARTGVSITGATQVGAKPLSTSVSDLTALITAIGTARTSASESDAGVTTAIAAVQTAVTLIGTAAANLVVDFDTTALSTRSLVRAAMRAADQVLASRSYAE